MSCSTETFIDHVAGHAGIPHETADAACRAVLRGLGAYLTVGEADLVADELPPALASVLVGGDVAIPVEERVLRIGGTAGHARELVASVCRVLAEELSNESLQTLRKAVPRDIGRLLDDPAPEIVRHATPMRRGASLASGRPGSAHPLSDAHPSPSQSDSVANANPHGPTKLSSARR